MSLCNSCPDNKPPRHCSPQIGLRIVSDGKGHVFECNRFDYYMKEA